MRSENKSSQRNGVGTSHETRSGHTALNLTPHSQTSRPKPRHTKQYHFNRQPAQSRQKQSFLKRVTNAASPKIEDSNTFALVIVGCMIFFVIILIISIMIGFHPPLPDSPVLRRLPSHHNIGSLNHDGHNHNNIKDESPSIADGLFGNIIGHTIPRDSIFVAMPSVNDPGFVLSFVFL